MSQNLKISQRSWDDFNYFISMSVFEDGSLTYKLGVFRPLFTKRSLQNRAQGTVRG